MARVLYARSVLILGDDHMLSALFTLQIDLLAYGVAARLYKNMEAQEAHARTLQEGDVVFFATVASGFVTDRQRHSLEAARDCRGVRLLGMSQDDEGGLSGLFDTFLLFGIPGSQNRGFSSLWLLSEIISEMLYDV